MKKLMLFIIISGLYVAPAFSQVGTIKGTVINSKNEPMAGVKIVFTEEETEAFKQEILSKDKGSFILTGLKPGHHYTATFTFEGYNTQVYNFKQWIGANDDPIVITLFTYEEAFVQQGGDLEALAADKATREFYNTAVNFFKEKKYAEALTAMEQSWEQYEKIQEDSESLEELIVIPRFYAIVAYNNQKLELAKKYCDIYLAKKPEDKHLLELKDIVERALAGPSAQELYNKAVEFINKNDDAAALKILNQVVKTDPDYALSYYQLAGIQTREFEFEKAIAYYKKFIKLDPKNKLVKDAKEMIVTLSE
jgi:tetratricopeptide (TPR) repeat protein